MLLITGATGFVMSVLARHWLERDPGARAVLLDRAPLDAAATRHFAPVADRMHLVQADVTDPAALARALDGLPITRIVHGATITPIARGTAASAAREPERDDPAGILAINLMGTMHVLDWARRHGGIARFVYVSSGSVYKAHGPDRPGEPLPEDGYVRPRRLYGISKLAAEMVTERYAALFGLSCASVRLSSVYGPMDRATATRDFRHVPNRVAHLALARRPIRVNTLDGVGDYIQSGDVAEAISRIAAAPTLRHAVYNIAAGVTVTTGDLVAWAAERVPGTSAEIVAEAEADIVQDPTQRDGQWGAYDISRMTAELGWRPRPVREAFLDYMDWIAREER